MLRNDQKIDAIAWKATSEKMSYGIFYTTLTEKRKQQIYEEYDVYLTKKKEKEEARLQETRNKIKKDKGKTEVDES